MYGIVSVVTGPELKLVLRVGIGVTLSATKSAL